MNLPLFDFANSSSDVTSRSVSVGGKPPHACGAIDILVRLDVEVYVDVGGDDDGMSLFRSKEDWIGPFKAAEEGWSVTLTCAAWERTLTSEGREAPVEPIHAFQLISDSFNPLYHGHASI